MDIRRPTPHFTMGANRPVATTGGAAVVTQQNPAPQPQPEPKQQAPQPVETKEVEEPAQQAADEFAFEPAPPPPPKVEKVYQSPVDAAAAQQNPASTAHAQVIQPTHEVQQVAADHATEAFKPTKPVKQGKHVNIKYVAVGAVAFALLFAVSVVWQQMAISDLKNDRKVLGERADVVNPIRAGADPDAQ